MFLGHGIKESRLRDMVRFKLKRSGVRELLKSDWMAGECMEHAEATVEAAGEGYEAVQKVGKNRVYCDIAPTTIKARVDNFNNNTLLKSLR